jgi:phospho-N-acetylmuramoyl-pentapeptide-transferase
VLVDLVAWFGASPDTARHVFIRTIASGLTAFLLGLLLGPTILALLRRMKLREKVGKSPSPELAKLLAAKENTPTMGGLMILPSLLISILLWGNFRNPYISLAFLGTLGFSLIGSIDDLIKLRYTGRRGLTSAAKLILQCMVSGALAFGLWLVMQARSGVQTEALGYNPLLTLAVPFTDWTFDLSAFGGVFFLVLSVLIMVGTSNGVNLSDGMDGLAPGCVVIAALAFAVIAFAVGRPDYAEHLSVLHVRGAQEMVIVSAALAGSAVAFLWYNAFPAQVFLGDTGSLPLGGLLGYVAIVSKQELVLPLVGGVFLVEALSVILQVGSYKIRRKRIFRCAPVHHHFQLGGVHEVKIVVRFWIVAALCAILGLATLRFR